MKKRLAEYAAQIKEIHELGVQIGIVIGGGNIFRGLSGANKGFDRVKGDQMGMLATVINSLALSSALVATGVKARVRDGGPHGTYRRILQQMESHRVHGSRRGGHHVCRNGQSVLHD